MRKKLKTTKAQMSFPKHTLFTLAVNDVSWPLYTSEGELKVNRWEQFEKQRRKMRKSQIKNSNNRWNLSTCDRPCFCIWMMNHMKRKRGKIYSGKLGRWVPPFTFFTYNIMFTWFILKVRTVNSPTSCFISLVGYPVCIKYKHLLCALLWLVCK